MAEVFRTPEDNFAGLRDFDFEPHWHDWEGLRVHYLDEGPREAPVMLLLHGMPTWSYLYRDVIPPLVAAGFRCIAPDHLGFGKSDKPGALSWYSIARHTEVLTSLIGALDLREITLVCQDWGGPTGLAQAAMMPERFRRLVIMNTWLHHEGYEYSPGIRGWHSQWMPGGAFDRPQPDVGLLMVLSAGYGTGKAIYPHIAAGTRPPLEGAAEAMHQAYIAPFAGLPDAAYHGLRRFPLSIPLDDAFRGNGPAQALHYERLLAWEKPVQFIWGCQDPVFLESWGRSWAARLNAPFDALEDAGHFPQNTHGKALAELILKRA